MRRIYFAAVPLAFLPTVGGAQQVPTTTLSRASAEFAEPFTQVSGLRELPDGRVVVADARERILQVLDFRTGEARPIGREGEGPREWRLPMRVYPLPGDSTLVWDVGNMRYLVLGPDASPAYTFSLLGGEGQNAPAAGGGPGAGRPPAAQGGGRPQGAPGGGRPMAAGPMVAGGLRQPSGVDSRGRIYFATPPFRMGQRGPETVDSSTITRYDRATGRTDTIATIHVPGARVAGGQQGPNQVRLMVRLGSPFDARDEWAVAPDGRVALVRHDPFRVDWVAPAGTVTRGPVQSYTPIRVTDADRREVLEAQRRGAAMRIEGGPGGARVSVGAPPPDAQQNDTSDWPATKPPFLAGAARVAPNGHLWLLRTRAAGDRVRTYDVFDGAGRLVRRVALPRDTELVGFGARSLYVTRIDDDDLLWLQRIDAPELLGAR